MMNKITILGFATLLLGGFAHATVIYNADETNVNTVDNSHAVAGASSVSFNVGVLTIANTGPQNYNAGFASQENINSLLGRPLLPTETVKLSLTVDSITGDLSANGFEFGLSSDGTTFRPGGNAIFQIRAGNATATVPGNAFDGGGTAAFGLNELSVRDGFTGTFTADQTGYSFAFTDVILASGASAVYSGTFSSPTEYVSVVGASHFYATGQKTAAAMDINISVARIEVIPEPSSGMLLLSGLLLLARRIKR